MRLGIAHHLGWAVAVTATLDYTVVDRRRIELIDPDLPAAPIHHRGGTHRLHGRDEPPDDDALAALVAQVRAAAVRATASELDAIVQDLPEPILSMSIRSWPADFPTDIATQRRSPYEAQADSIMYLQVLAEAASERGWDVHFYDYKTVERQAAQILGERADEVLRGPRSTLGPPWAKDHRVALAATIVAS